MSKLRPVLEQFYWAVERKIAPGLKYSQLRYEEVLRSHAPGVSRWLDLGCGHQILPEWRLAAEQEIVDGVGVVTGIDFDLSSLKNHRTVHRLVRGDITKLPFGDCSFDLITANMVVEHLENPAAQFREIHRVLEPGGIFLFHTPSVNSYPTILARLVPEALKPGLIVLLDGRQDRDVFKTHYRANSAERLRKLGKQCDFEMVGIEMTTTTALFAVIPPLVVFELLWIRLLMTDLFRWLRPGIIGVFRKTIT